MPDVHSVTSSQPHLVEANSHNSNLDLIARSSVPRDEAPSLFGLNFDSVEGTALF
jgi:hypothetical protein